jgi:hypothetical protein
MTKKHARSVIRPFNHLRVNIHLLAQKVKNSLLPPIGYEDENGFHFGPERKSFTAH